jgi:hypothetical protein
MATISMADASTRTLSPSYGGNVKLPYMVEFELNFATAATSKGSALANADVIECIRIPANTVVLFAGFQVKTAVGGASADNTIILGDGVDDNRWVDTFDLDAALAAAHGTIVIATANPTIFATTDTIDVKFTGATTAPTSGVLRVYALMVDVTDLNAPGIAAVGS